jgi:hypothetical protein
VLKLCFQIRIHSLSVEIVEIVEIVEVVEIVQIVEIVEIVQIVEVIEPVSSFSRLSPMSSTHALLCASDFLAAICLLCSVICLPSSVIHHLWF